MRFTPEQLAAFRDRTIPDLMPTRPRLVFVGINPGLWTAATGTPFSHPGNRFWPALVAAGILPRLPAFTGPLDEADRALILDVGIGITALVRRATARADELTSAELRAGAERVSADIGRWRPRVVAVVGLTAYRTGFRAPRATAGRQERGIRDVETWVVPHPSGLNTHDTVASLAAAYAGPARAAGIIA